MKRETKLYPGGLFQCHEMVLGEEQVWMGRWAIRDYENERKVRVEMVVEGRSGLTAVVFGEYRREEYYICLPDLDVGCPLSFDGKRKVRSDSCIMYTILAYNRAIANTRQAEITHTYRKSYFYLPCILLWAE